MEYEEQDGFFWHLKYPVAGGDEFVELATTRPETMLGDTAIAVHPDDERYTHLHGKKVILPLVGKEIPVLRHVCGPGIRHGRGEDHSRA